MPLRASVALRHEVRALYWGGMKGPGIALKVGVANTFVYRLLKKFPWRLRKRNSRNLSFAEREEISKGLSARLSIREIARRLGRAPSTISREVAASERVAYRAWISDERAERLAARPKLLKLERCERLRKQVEKLLALDWSPRQIAKHLCLKHPNAPTMKISHESIYKALYVQGRGALRAELRKHLRQARPKRRRQGKAALSPHIRNMVNISQRPAEAADRAVPGHWEGDLIIGKDNQSAIGTLVERSTRYVMLLDLRKGRTAEHVRQALTKKIQKLPVELARSLTWDQGRELSGHARFTLDTGMKVFFCDPHSPWQRGSNENTNGLLRQYFPKGTDLNRHSGAELDRIARRLNGRPRETLGWKTPAEKLDEFLAQPVAA